MDIRTNMTIPVNRNGVHVGDLTFDPSNTAFVRKFYEMQAAFRASKDRYIEDARKIPKGDGLAFVALQERICKDVYHEIDGLFGDGTSAMVFGDAMSVDAIVQFLDAVADCVSAERAKKTAKYTRTKDKVLRQ